jgi:hypothetical protein
VSFPNATKEVKPIFHHTWGGQNWDRMPLNMTSNSLIR